MQLLIVYSINVLLVVTVFPELSQFFQCFLQIIVGHYEDLGLYQGLRHYEEPGRYEKPGPYEDPRS